MVASGALLTINDALAKLMTAHYPVGQLMFMRGVFVLLPIAFLVWRAGGTRVLRVRNPKGQLLRGITVILGSFLFVTALKLMPLADAIAITFAGPLFLTAMATPLLAETVGWRRWLAVVVGFCGVVLMLRPTGAFQWVALLPLAVALLGAFRDIITRAMVGSESTLSILFVSTLMVDLERAGHVAVRVERADSGGPGDPGFGRVLPQRRPLFYDRSLPLGRGRSGVAVQVRDHGLGGDLWER